MATDPLVAFGSRVRDLRLALGWSQERLAEASGLHRNYIGGIERGERNCALRTIHALAGALGVHPADLLTDPWRGVRPGVLSPAWPDGRSVAPP